jgi:hypothetical protein
MRSVMNDPFVFASNNEPYLGLNSLMVFDDLILVSINLNNEASKFTRNHQLSGLQKAAAQILPQGFNVALSIRELIRQGHLFTAVVLLNSLIERVGIISYLANVPSAIEHWDDGWHCAEKPSLVEMLRTLSDGKELNSVNQTVSTLDHLVSGDPMGDECNLLGLDGDALGFHVGRVTDNEKLCDFLCYQAISWLMVLNGMTSSIFPDIPNQKAN